MSVIRSLFSSRGRVPRFNFWIASLLLLASYGLLLGPLFINGEGYQPLSWLIILASVSFLFTFPLAIAMAIKRCHDRNHAGHYLFLLIVPLVNLWLLFELAFLRGKKGANEFGPDPQQEIVEPAIVPASAQAPERQSSPQPALIAPDRAVTPLTFANSKPYEKACWYSTYDEVMDERLLTFYLQPEFNHVLSLLNYGDKSGALQAAEALLPKYADFALVYCWMASALIDMGQLEQARAVLTTGLEKSITKHPLCNLLGLIAWKAGYLTDAVYWWAQGLHCQETLSAYKYGGDRDPYLYLATIAEALGLTDSARAFIARVDQINPNLVRLSPEAASNLANLARQANSSALTSVVRELASRLHSGPTVMTCPCCGKQFPCDESTDACPHCLVIFRYSRKGGL